LTENQLYFKFPSFTTRRGASVPSLYLASKELSRRNQALAQFPPTGVGGGQRVVSA